MPPLPPQLQKQGLRLRIVAGFIWTSCDQIVEEMSYCILIWWLQSLQNLQCGEEARSADVTLLVKDGHMPAIAHAAHVWHKPALWSKWVSFVVGGCCTASDWWLRWPRAP